jgi:hypothetical protein
MSFPPGTEMFQFPGFASAAYGFSCRYPIGVGFPIRISTDQRLLAAPRGFSQRATSFIASWCQGIHRMPFSRSRSKPAMHRSHPHNRNRGIAPAQAGHLLSTLEAPSGASKTPLNTLRCRLDPLAEDPVRHGNNARPETHQNLIHPDKDHMHRKPKPPAHQRHTGPIPKDQAPTCRMHFLLCDDRSTAPPDPCCGPWWRRSGSNRRPPACKAGALPAELRPR